MLSVILLSMLIMVLSNQGLTKHLTCDNKNNCFFSFSLINETLYTGAWSSLLILMLEKSIWFCLTSLIIDLTGLGLLMWKWMCLFLRTHHLLECWGYLSLLNWIEALKLSLLLKLSLRILEPSFALWNLFLLTLLFISINVLHKLTWNTVVMSGMVFLTATWNC